MSVQLSLNEFYVLKTAVELLCKVSHRHEVQYWLDYPGTPEERLRIILDGLRSIRAMLVDLEEEQIS